MSARDDVLARIEAAHRLAPPPRSSYTDIERRYRTRRDEDHDQLIRLLVDRLLDYKALVRQTDAEQLPQMIAQALAERGVRSLIVPDGLEQSWLAGEEIDSGPERVPDRPEAPLGVADLDRADGVITGCALAVAETGTLILDAGPGQGRRALTLVPDYHLCVVRPADVCADVPQAMARLDLSRPITMISGPSATSDIELNRVEGVHGPRTLEVIVVG